MMASQSKPHTLKFPLTSQLVLKEKLVYARRLTVDAVVAHVTEAALPRLRLREGRRISLQLESVLADSYVIRVPRRFGPTLHGGCCGVERAVDHVSIVACMP